MNCSIALSTSGLNSHSKKPLMSGVSVFNPNFGFSNGLLSLLFSLVLICLPFRLAFVCLFILVITN